MLILKSSVGCLRIRAMLEEISEHCILVIFVNYNGKRNKRFTIRSFANCCKQLRRLFVADI